MALAAVIVVALAAVGMLALATSRASSRAARAGTELAEARAEVGELDAQLAEAIDRAATAATAVTSARADADEARGQAAAIEARAAELRRGAEALDRLVAALWELELLRQSRVWEVIAAGMPGPSVAADTGAELTAALEMELQRVREEGGVPGEMGKSDVGDVPVPAALVGLRLSQELIASLGRTSDWLNVTAHVRGGELIVAIEASAQAQVPSVVRDLARRAGAAVGGSGHTVEVRIPIS